MTNSFNLYAFSSQNMTNIWAGVGAETWAIPADPNPTTRGKAAKLATPSFGILYAAAEKILTVPFVILTCPDPKKIESGIWHGDWALPFRIKPLGTPRKTLSMEEAKSLIPSFRRLGTTHFSKVFRVGGAYAFNRCDVTQLDWDILVKRLSD